MGLWGHQQDGGDHWTSRGLGGHTDACEITSLGDRGERGASSVCPGSSLIQASPWHLLWWGSLGLLRDPSLPLTSGCLSPFSRGQEEWGLCLQARGNIPRALQSLFLGGVPQQLPLGKLFRLLTRDLGVWSGRLSILLPSTLLTSGIQSKQNGGRSDSPKRCS